MKKKFFLIFGIFLIYSISALGYINPNLPKLSKSQQSNITNIFQINYNISSNVTHLNNLSDVNIPSPTNNDVLRYDSATSKWINQQLSQFISFFDSWLFWNGNQTQFNETRANNTYVNVDGDTMTGNLNITGNLNVSGNAGVAGNITAGEYLFGQPIDGSIGSGIIWINNTNQFGEVAGSCSGLICNYSAFKVRLVNTTNDVIYCDMPSGSVTLTDNQHNVVYVDRACSVQKISIQTYKDTPISPGGIADFMNVIAYDGQTDNVNGIGLESKRIIKMRKIFLQSEGKHLSVVDGGLNYQLNAFPRFNITAGNYVYLTDIVPTTKKNTLTDFNEVFYHSGVGTWTHEDQTGLNLTTCDTGTGTTLCSNPTRYRRHFIFIVGNNDSGTDETGIHQLLPLESVSYVTLADCLNTETYPLQYTLPDYYEYGAVVIYAYCGRASDSSWVSTNFIDMRTVKSGSASSMSEGIYVKADGTTPLTANWNAVFNITANWFNGKFNWTTLTSWLGFDGSTLNFNETRLNTTINAQGVNAGFNSTYNETYAGYGGRIDEVNNSILWKNVSGTAYYNGNVNISGDLRVYNSVLFVNSTRVGIGTTNPLGKLSIAGAESSVAGVDRATIILEDTNASKWTINSFGMASAEGGGKFGINEIGVGSRLIIQNVTGHVGIGTTAPLGTLHVFRQGTGINLILDKSSTNPQMAYSVNGSQKWLNYLETSTGKFKIFETALGDVMTFVNGTGNVGIGTTSPAQKLHISGSGEIIEIIESSDNNVGLHIKSATASYPYIRFFQGGTGQFEIGKVASDGNFYFNNNVASGETGASMAITDSGDVSFGTGSSVLSKVHLRTNFNGRGIYIDSYTGTRIMEVTEAGVTGVTNSSYLNMYNNSVSKIVLNANGDSYITSGKLGIGASVPAQRLEVEDTASATPLRVQDSSNTCDFGVDGSGWASISCSSDESLKTNIKEVSNETLQNISDWVFNYPLKEYTWTSNNETTIGAIAQDIQILYPEKVETKEELNLELNTTESVLFIEVPTLRDIIVSIQRIWNKLMGIDSRVAKIEAENSAMKQALCELGRTEFCGVLG